MAILDTHARKISLADGARPKRDGPTWRRGVHVSLTTIVVAGDVVWVGDMVA
jgi:hypothetical protein